MRTLLFASLFCLIANTSSYAADEKPWLTIEPGTGAGNGKHIVFISGDEEYRSEEALPQLAKILAKHHGFRCTVLFAIDPKTGTINPTVRDNIPGTEQLKDADLLVIFTRYRDLPDEQMKPIVDYINCGKPVIGLRTATHAFNIDSKKPRSYKQYSAGNKEWDGGFGRQILGETWVNHHGQHGKQGTRGIVVEDQKDHPILRGIASGDIFGTTDVYGVRLPLPGDCSPLILGEATATLKPDSPKVEGKVNNPMMPVAWTKTYTSNSGTKGRVFTSTLGASQDMQAEGTRRLFVNACYWALGLEDKIPAKSDVGIVGTFTPSPFKFDGHVKGKKPSDYAN
ncbi:MAG: ThuA domain-containing protein [Gemmatales bacterium]